MCPVDQHESIGSVIFIDGNGHWRMGQKTTHFGINGLSVFCTEKVMGGVHGTTPKVNQSGAIFRARCADCIHGNFKPLQICVKYDRPQLPSRIRTYGTR